MEGYNGLSIARARRAHFVLEVNSVHARFEALADQTDFSTPWSLVEPDPDRLSTAGHE